MNTIEFEELARVPIVKTQDVLLARFVGRDVAGKLGFSPAMMTRVTTAISEITRNVIQHAGCAGDIQIGRSSDGGRVALRIIVADKGKGIDFPERFLADGKLNPHGAGLPGTFKLVDRFEIRSSPGAGTVVTMDFWAPAAA